MAALIAIMPQSSPCAPAFGDSATAAMPVSSSSQRESSSISSSAPGTVESGCSGWMSPKPGSRAMLLVEARIVLHRAGAEREEPGVDAVVLLRQAHIVAHRLGLGEAGKADLALALERAEARLEGRGLVEIDAGRLGAADLEDQRLLLHQGAVAGEGRMRGGRGLAGRGGPSLAVEHDQGLRMCSSRGSGAAAQCRRMALVAHFGKCAITADRSPPPRSGGEGTGRGRCRRDSDYRWPRLGKTHAHSAAKLARHLERPPPVPPRRDFVAGGGGHKRWPVLSKRSQVSPRRRSVTRQRISADRPPPREAAGRVRVGGAADAIAIIVGRASARRMRSRRPLARHLERPPPVPSPPLLRRGGRGRQRRPVLSKRSQVSPRRRSVTRQRISADRPPPPAKRRGGYGWGALPPQ